MLNLSRGEDLIRNEGDFFRDMRHVQVPGIDNLNQLGPAAVNREDTTYAVNNNFPKLASSAAHLFGRPRVWTEGGGGTGVDGKFQLDYQLVRGVNAPQIRIPAIRGAGMSGEAPPQAAMLAWYTNRASYLLAIGRPAAQVALYHPASSMWLGDEEADRSTTKLGKQLLEHQVDFDYFDEQLLSSVATLESGGFRNLSGQVYRAVIVPSSTVISRTALNRLRAMAASGGKVIFVGVAPSLVLDRTFLDAKEEPDLGFATLLEPAGDITARVVAALPKPDVALDSPCPSLKYTHRTWRDADLYFFFNESDQPQSRTVSVAGRGQAQVWDAGTGEIHVMTGAAAGTDSLRLPLVLAPYEAKIVVIGAALQTAGAPEPSFAIGDTIAEFPLDAPVTQFQKQVTLNAKPAGKRFYLECVDVHDYARLRVNGKDLGARAWKPYRWDVTDAMAAGANQIEIEVRTLPPGGRGGATGGAQPAGGRGAAAPPPVPGVVGAVRLVARGQ